MIDSEKHMYNFLKINQKNNYKEYRKSYSHDLFFKKVKIVIKINN